MLRPFDHQLLTLILFTFQKQALANNGKDSKPLTWGGCMGLRVCP